MTNHIKVVDSIMGSGKTSSAINLMNGNTDNNYIYITPYLPEVKRIKGAVNKRFYEPNYFHSDKSQYSSKFESLHKLLSEEKSIVSTHALFKRANRETRELIHNGNYILILDEVMDVVEQLNIKKNDLETLFAMKLLYEEDGYLLWNEEKSDWDSRYNDIRDMALNYNLIKYMDRVLIWTFPADIFKAFKEVYILTYQFDAQIQKYYYDLHNLKYKKYIATKEEDTYKFKPRPNNYSEKEFKNKLKQKINIVEHDKLNRIGSEPYTLSKSWYIRSSDDILNQLKRHTENYYRNIVKSKANENLWTTFKDFQTKIQGKRYTKAFIPLNTRATNDHKDRFNLAYLVNRFPNTVINNFLKTRGIHIDDDLYALSECLQWIFRSAIREDREVNLYIPSHRMRTLLKLWLDDKPIKYIYEK